MSEQNPPVVTRPAQKPQAVSHMLWFFVIPCLAFMGWASYRFASGMLHPKPRDAFAKLSEMEGARTPGDRWQAAYGLAQALQKMSHEGELAALETAKKDELYARLTAVLKTNATDSRLKKYLLLTMGQMGDLRALPALEENTRDPAPETRFYAAWGLIDMLTKHPEAVTPAHLDAAGAWLKDEDPAFRKIAAAFLVQQKGAPKRAEVAALLKDPVSDVRWNTAVALASAGDASAKPVLKEVFSLEALREANFSNAEDLQRTVATAYQAAQKLGDRELLALADALKARVQPENPEGRAIHSAIR